MSLSGLAPEIKIAMCFAFQRIKWLLRRKSSVKRVKEKESIASENTL